MLYHDPTVTIRRFGQTTISGLHAYRTKLYHRGWRIFVDPDADPSTTDHDQLEYAVQEDPAFLESRTDVEIETWLVDTDSHPLRDALMAEYRRRTRVELEARRAAWMAKHGEKWSDRADEIWAAGYESAHLVLFGDRAEVETENEGDLIARALQETRAYA